MLSGNDVEVDDGDYHQRTALHLAASNGHIAMVRHLVLIHGANMNVLDRSAASPPPPLTHTLPMFNCLQMLSRRELLLVSVLYIT